MLETYLEVNSINANVQYEANVNQSVTAFKNGSCEYALVAEPQLTALESQYPNLNILNIGNEICEKGEFVPQAALFVNPESTDDEDVMAFKKNLKRNIEKLNNKSKEYAKDLLDSGITYFSYSQETLEKALPRCNLAYMQAKDNKDTIIAYYDSCDKYNNTFNGARPSEEFYK